MIALLEAKRAGLFKTSHWLNNLVAGIVVGVVALPLSMAFAIASGARPEQGIYTAIVAGLIVTLFGGSRLQIAGPTGAFIAVLAGITATYGIVGLQVATFMAGVILLLMGLLRMGGVVRFIPAPVIIGFTAGIGIIIFTGQWADFLGLERQVGGISMRRSSPSFGKYHRLIGQRLRLGWRVWSFCYGCPKSRAFGVSRRPCWC
jgi:sulfate permease, SulP family